MLEYASKQNPAKSAKKQVRPKGSKSTHNQTAACVDIKIQASEEYWECVICGDMWSHFVPGENWTFCRECDIGTMKTVAQDMIRTVMLVTYASVKTIFILNNAVLLVV